MKRALAWTKLLGIALFVYILAGLDYSHVAEILLRLHPGWLVLYLLLLPMSPTLKSLRWHLVQRSLAGHANWVGSLSINFETLFLAFTTPGRVGDMLKVLLLEQRQGVPKKTGLVIYLYDRIQDLLFMALVTLVSMRFVFQRHFDTALTAVLLAVVVLYLCKNTILRRVARRYGVQQTLTTNLPFELVMLVVNSVIYSLLFLQVYCLALALGIEIGYLQIAAVHCLGAIITLVPVSVSGLGMREGVFILLLKDFGVNAEQAVMLSLLDNVVFTALVTIVLNCLNILFLRKREPSWRSRERIP